VLKYPTRVEHRDHACRRSSKMVLAFWSKTLPGFKNRVFVLHFATTRANNGTNTTIDMAKLTKRDIVVAISNQTGMVPASSLRCSPADT